MAEKILYILVKYSLLWIGCYLLLPILLSLTFEDKSRAEALDITSFTIAIGVLLIGLFIPVYQNSVKGISAFLGLCSFFLTLSYLRLPFIQHPINHKNSVVFIIVNLSIVLLIQILLNIIGVLWHSKLKILNIGLAFLLGFLNLFTTLLTPDSDLTKTLKSDQMHDSTVAKYVVRWISKNTYFTESQNFLIIGFLTGLLILYASSLNEE